MREWDAPGQVGRGEERRQGRLTLRLAPEPVQVSELLSATAMANQANAAPAGVTVTVADIVTVADSEAILVMADPVRARQSAGSGLGLAIVRRLTEAHKGTVTAVSTPNVGSTFTLRLPRHSSTTRRLNGGVTAVACSRRPTGCPPARRPARAAGRVRAGG